MTRLSSRRNWRIFLVISCVLAGLAFFYLRASDATNLANSPSTPKSVLPRTSEDARKSTDTLIPVAKANSTKTTREQRDEKYCVDHFGALNAGVGADAFYKTIEQKTANSAQSLFEKLKAETANGAADNLGINQFLIAVMRQQTGGLESAGSSSRCGEDEACQQKFRSKIDQAWQADFDGVAKLALHSNDPKLYALAFHGCAIQRQNKTPVCQQITAAQWAHRDPENGAAWLQVLNETGQEKTSAQSAVIENALFRLSQSKQIEWGLTQFSPSFETNNFDLLEASLLSSGVMGVFAANMNGYSAALALCNSKALLDSNRFQVCNDVAERLLSSRANMLDGNIGLGLARKLAWPTNKIARFEEERDAISAFLLLDRNASLTSHLQKTETPLSACRHLAVSQGLFEDGLLVGERQAVLNRIKNSGIDRVALVARYRESKEKSAKNVNSEPKK
jgi:hypothetical protein